SRPTSTRPAEQELLGRVDEIINSHASLQACHAVGARGRREVFSTAGEARPPAAPRSPAAPDLPGGSPCR
ncbi:hypothetical protein, partial [Kribbella sp. DT2]|uniref:hypothetical protein n=1 Tax=Kribbella sp. DT2 TaxID=3393427 RepID=UPI003CFB72DA